MNLEELLRHIPGNYANSYRDIPITGISFDSRRVVPGDLFVCLSGAVEDGHLYAFEAAAKGASAILAERELSIDTIPVIVVSDTRKTLAQVAAEFYGNPSSQVKLIGVTGTNGKTTTVNLLRHILNATGHPCGTIGTLGMNIGNYSEKTANTTPESSEIQRLLRKMVDEGAEYAALEVSSQGLDMGRLSEVQFHTAVFTNLTHDHLDYHGNFHNYKEAKKILFSHLDQTGEHGDHYAVLNIDDPNWQEFASVSSAKILTYGLAESACVRASNIRISSSETSFIVSAEGLTAGVRWAMPGVFNVYNALAAISVGLANGIPLDKLAAALESFPGVEGRFETLESPRGIKVVIDYAHTPDALQNLLTTVRQVTTGHVYCVFGCEGDKDRQKRPLMTNIAYDLSDYPILTLDNTRNEDIQSILSDMLVAYEQRNIPRSRYAVIENRREAIWCALECAAPGDVVVIAGKGHEKEQIIGKHSIPFNDKKVVLEYFKERSSQLRVSMS